MNICVHWVNLDLSTLGVEANYSREHFMMSRPQQNYIVYITLFSQAERNPTFS